MFKREFVIGLTINVKLCENYDFIVFSDSFCLNDSGDVVEGVTSAMFRWRLQISCSHERRKQVYQWNF
jgi:hypothetical protein